MKKSICRGCLALPILLIALAVAAWLLRVRVLTGLASGLVENDGPHKADAIVVLGGDEYGTRVIEAAQLEEQGYAPYVLVSGIILPMEREPDVMIAYAGRQGYPGSIFRPLPNHADSTRSEVGFLGAYFKAHGIRKIILVTSNFHTARAARLMRTVNPWVQVYVVPAPDPFFTPESWWRTRNGQKTFLVEWEKTIATWLGG
ncbi:MAG: YdcF family protein [Bryobacteraceae bacterium]